jgi:hypothetical protein
MSERRVRKKLAGRRSLPAGCRSFEGNLLFVGASRGCGGVLAVAACRLGCFFTAGSFAAALGMVTAGGLIAAGGLSLAAGCGGRLTVSKGGHHEAKGEDR